MNLVFSKNSTSLAILFDVDKDLALNFLHAILLFGLPIYLKMKYN